MTDYSRKNDAIRAAKKALGDNGDFTIDVCENGRWTWKENAPAEKEVFTSDETQDKSELSIPTHEPKEPKMNEDLKQVLADAEVAFKAAVEAEAAAKEEAKDAAKNHKAAVAYAKVVTDESAKDAEAGWAAEAQRTQEVAEAAKEAVKTARAAVAEAKKNLKSGGKGESEPRISQNGQTRPRPDSNSGKLWDLFDAASAERGSACAIADVFEEAKKLDMTEGSIRSSYSHWRKFHGIEKGRIHSVEEANMSAERRAAAIAQVTELLDKARSRVQTLETKLASLAA